MLLFVISIDESVLYDETKTPEEKAETLLEVYKILRKELKTHHATLDTKPYVIGINKIDLYDATLKKAIHTTLKSLGEVSLFSAATHEGIDDLKEALFS